MILITVSFALRVLKRNPDERQRFRVALLPAFKLQQVVVSTAAGVGKLSADRRSGMVDGAIASIRVQELAGLAKHRISFTSKHAFLLVDLCVAS